MAVPASEIVHAVEGMRAIAIWGTGAALGFLAVILGYLGVALMSLVKADSKELQEYRYRAFRDLVELISALAGLIRDLIRNQDAK